VAAPRNLTVRSRIGYLRATMRNWPLIFVDKLGLRRLVRYRTRGGDVVWCRARSTDVNEAVAVLAGVEYPFRFASLNDGAFVVDAGANIGSFVLLLQSLNRAITFRGIAIEPFDETVALLRRNLAENHVAGFEIVHGVLNDVDGSARIRTDVSPDAISISSGGRGVEVSSVRLSTYCVANRIDRIDLLKMDVEGAEYRIIDSEYELLRTRVVRAIIEYHEIEGHRGLQWLVRRLEPDFAVEVVHARAASGLLHARNKTLAPY
jgi:FkbM family methyltransferase